MEVRLEDYEEFVGAEEIRELHLLADHVNGKTGKRVRNINSTSVGGGVAEILTRMIPLLRGLGIDASWDVIKGAQDFFEVTKTMHNALQGDARELPAEMLEVYRATTEENLHAMELDGDIILVHDPQPLGLVQAREGKCSKWVWRCHIDISAPNEQVWKFLQPQIARYDAAIFSMPDFAQSLPISQYMVAPSIDPIADKNKDLSEETVTQVLQKYGVDPERPVITQISRFDRWKDPVGVIAAYRMARRYRDCQLVLAGGGATDDPEGAQVLAEVRQQAGDDPDIHILLLPPFSDIEINALVRGSTVVLQKSIREGFGLTVSEAMWKGKPVIGGAVGGIKTQVLDGVTGFLVHSPEGAARRLVQLLEAPDLCKKMGANGRLHVKENFLVTRHVKDYLLVMLALDHPDEDVVDLSA